jgi:hypothetical protein
VYAETLNAHNRLNGLALGLAWRLVSQARVIRRGPERKGDACELTYERTGPRAPAGIAEASVVSSRWLRVFPVKADCVET